MWLKANGFVTDSCTSIDIHEDPTILDHYHLMVSFGHDEYWSKEMRDHVENFISTGGNVVFLSGNTCWWQIRFEDGNRKMICYKSAIDDALTIEDHQRATFNWASLLVDRPENSMTGVNYRNGAGWFYPYSDNRWKEAKYRVHAADHWVFEDTGLKDNDLFGAWFFQFPEHVGALVAYYGILFATTSSNELWWRPAVCVPSPLYTGSLMFYNQLQGNAAIGPFSGNGDFRTLQNYW